MLNLYFDGFFFVFQVNIKSKFICTSKDVREVFRYEKRHKLGVQREEKGKLTQAV